MPEIRLYDNDHYYPPTDQNLSRIREDVSTAAYGNDPGELLVIEQALAEAHRKQDVEHPSSPNPYFDIVVRCAQLRHLATARRSTQLFADISDI